ncbi:unnamed protein product [Ambrosiozyma monospora]|uniref:Unnamed protein product n=1 Tax=Ambrosiozyma monospora TaxID=43982 RepID=A0A9W6Z2D8_AMBMO|nr:unnamed protein product [Ambrosiozyma monospora]
MIPLIDGKPATQDELDYVPTIFENSNCFVTNKESGKTYKLSLHDTAGQVDFKDLRTPVYMVISIWLSLIILLIPVFRWQIFKMFGFQKLNKQNQMFLSF